MKKRNLMSTVSLVVLGFIFGIFVVAAFSWERPSANQVIIGAENPPIEKINVDAEKMNNAFIEVAEKVTPSIVQITVVSSNKNENGEESNDPFQKFFFRFRDELPRESQKGGSGVIISKDGYIVTNNHVVENATKVSVQLNDKRNFDAVVVGTDPNTDLAVIKIEAKDLPVVYFGNSDEVRIGEWVMAIGNPLSFTSTVTAGIVSGRGRDLNIIRNQNDNGYSIEDFIQTDAAINPGNSGGALVDLSGALIGINTAIATNGVTANYIGYGFAIPINLVKSVSRDLIEFGKVHRGYIGVQIEEIDAATAKAVGLNKPKGVMIQNVIEDGSAAKAGVKNGDVLLSVDGKEISRPNELQSYIGTKRAGDIVKLVLFRDGKEVTKDVKLKSKAGDDSGENLDKKLNTNKKEIKNKNQTKEFDDLGLTIKDINNQDRNEFKVEGGIKIVDVKQYGLAFNQRLRPDWIITEVNQKKIDSVEEFSELIKQNKGKAVLLKVVNKNTTRFVGIDIP